MASLAKGVLLYFEDLETFNECMEEAHQLPTIKAVFRYAQYGELPEKEKLGIDGMMFFNFVRKKIDRDIAKYKDTCEKNRLNGAKGGQTKAENLANASERYRTPPNRNRNRNGNKKRETETVTETEVERNNEEHNTLALPPQEGINPYTYAKLMLKSMTNEKLNDRDTKALADDIEVHGKDIVESALREATQNGSREKKLFPYYRGILKNMLKDKNTEYIPKARGYQERQYTEEQFKDMETDPFA